MTGWSETKETKPREIPEEGLYPARAIWMIDIGTHEDGYKGESYDKHEIYVAFELIGTKMSDGRPFLLGKFFRVSTSKRGFPYFAETSNAMKMMKSWFANEDQKNIMFPSYLAAKVKANAPAKVMVSINNGYANIELIKPGDGSIYPAENPTIVYEILKPIDDRIPQWLVSKIKSSKEETGEPPIAKDYSKGKSQSLADSDIPF